MWPTDNAVGLSCARFVWRLNTAVFTAEHILLAFTREQEGMAARMLSIFGVLTAVQTETLRVMAGYEPEPLSACGRRE